MPKKCALRKPKPHRKNRSVWKPRHKPEGTSQKEERLAREEQERLEAEATAKKEEEERLAREEQERLEAEEKAGNQEEECLAMEEEAKMEAEARAEKE